MLMIKAKKIDFESYGVVINGKERKLKQIKYKDEVLKHIELTDEAIVDMWGDLKMKPLTQAELDLILADEPIEEV